MCHLEGGGVWVALLGKVKGSYFRGCLVIVLCIVLIRSSMHGQCTEMLDSEL